LEKTVNFSHAKKCGIYEVKLGLKEEFHLLLIFAAEHGFLLGNEALSV
jgi:hypothetical protein